MTEKSFGKWFVEQRIKAGYIFKKDLAKAADVDPSTLTKMENNENKPKPETLMKLAPHVKVSYNELLARAGHLDENTAKKVIELSQKIDTDKQELEKLKNLKKSIDNINKQSTKNKVLINALNSEIELIENLPSISLPILGKVAAGIPIEQQAAEAEEFWPIPRYAVPRGFESKPFFLRVHGHSMVDAGINDGDLVLVIANNHAENGQIIIAEVDGKYTCKKYHIDSNGEESLLSCGFGPSKIIPSQEARIIGVVRLVIKKIGTW